MKAKTTVTKGNLIDRSWHLVDVSGKTLGRVCVQIASILNGKNKVDFSPNRDAGDYVVVINADKVIITGNKAKEKVYYSYSGFPGGLKEFTFEELMARDPRRVITHAVAGMVAKNRLRKSKLTRLKVFVGATHPYNDKINIQK